MKLSVLLRSLSDHTFIDYLKSNRVKPGIKKACKASNNRKIKFNIKKSHQNISGGIFGGEPINFDLFLTFYNN